MTTATATLKQATIAAPQTDAVELLRFLFRPEQFDTYVALRVQSLDFPDIVLVRAHQGQFKMMQRDPRPLEAWIASNIYGSPNRPRVEFSPLTYMRPTSNSVEADARLIWARWPVSVIRAPKAPFPTISQESRRLVMERIANFPTPPHVLVDEGTAVVGFWRLRDGVSVEYAATVSDRIAIVSGGERVRKVSRAVFSPQQAARDFWVMVSGQKVATSPAHVVSFSIASEQLIRVEALAWAFPL